MNLKEWAIDTAKIVPPAIATVAENHGLHIPDVIQLCMLVYAIGLAVQTCYRLYLWVHRRLRSAA